MTISPAKASTRTPRRGAGNAWVLLACAALVAFATLLALLFRNTASNRSATGVQELRVYCAAGMQKPLELVAEAYQQEYGIRILLQFGGSNTLLSQIEISRTGDLYLAADYSYLEIACQKGLVEETLPLATMTAVVGVQLGNPKQIHRLDDLLREDVRVVLANPDQAAIGRTTREALQRTGDWSALFKRVKKSGVFKPTVGEVANDIKLGSIDTGILWDAVASQYPDIETLSIPQLANSSTTIAIGILSDSKHPTAALHFARYLAAQDQGLKYFAALGYQPVEGDAWEEVPELIFFSGAVNRRALEPILKRFAEREGVKITTVYNGCGILTAQMRTLLGQGYGASSFPDTFMACDRYYLEKVKDLFHDTGDISNVPIRLLVASGNPKKIKHMKDLARPGVRVALGEPDQCTIGVLSRRLLQSEGIYQQVLENNVVTQTATSSLLVPTIITGSADVALVYASDALAEANRLEVVPIDSPLALAVQPYAVARNSNRKHLSSRLLREITKSRKQFEAAGFQWEFDRSDSTNQD